MSTHSKKSPRSNSSQATTASKENRAMPNVVPPTSSSPSSFSECSNSSPSPTQQQQPQQQRTYYWHASTPSTSPAYHYGPVVVEPYYWQQQQQQQQQQQHPQQEWSSPPPPPPPPPTNVDVYQQMESLQTQVHEWRNNATSWQRHCEEINRAHEKETLKLKAKVNELIRQKSVLMERVRRYKTAVSSSPKSSSSSFISKKEDPTPVTPITKQVPETAKPENNSSPKEAASTATTKPVSILRSPKRTGGSLASSRPRPLKKRRVRLDDAAPKQVRCISPRTVSSAPPMPVTPPMPQVKWAAF